MNSEDIKYITDPIIKGERPIFYFVSEEKLNNIRNNSFLGDLLFALFSIFLGAALTDNVLMLYIVAFIFFILSGYFYIYKYILIHKTKNSGEVQSFKTESIINEDLEIINAVYGNKPDKIVDVTSKIQEMIKENKLETTASNALVNKDPDPGIVKSLYIQYKYGDKNISKKYTEKDEVKLP